LADTLEAALLPVVLVVLAVAFACSLGAHYTGACMGMPHALGAVSARGALLIMAPLTLLGAAVASHGVATTVGERLVARQLSVTSEIVAIGVAFVLTAFFNRARIPTSTVQIVVFGIAGAALASGVGVSWHTVGTLALIWVLAPPVAAGCGFVLTRAADLLGARHRCRRSAIGGRLGRAVPAGLVVVGAAASFTMGANDVANATGALVGTSTVSPLVASVVGGAGLAVGVLVWGRPLLTRMAFDIVEVDQPMATAAQLVQAGVVLSAVAFGFFTSMNQALVGAMAGAGLARGSHTVQRPTVLRILRGWIVGPGAAVVLAYGVARLLGATGITSVDN
jgi:inorganic phosphate transporter, PiT family